MWVAHGTRPRRDTGRRERDGRKSAYGTIRYRADGADNRDRPVFQQLAQDLFERLRPAQGETLPVIHAETGEHAPDALVLDAFGGGAETHGLGQLYDRTDHGLRTRARHNVTHQ